MDAWISIRTFYFFHFLDCSLSLSVSQQGLDPLKAGMATPMVSALTGSAAYHLFLSTPMCNDFVDAKKKAHFCLASYFIISGLLKGLGYIPFQKAKKA